MYAAEEYGKAACAVECVPDGNGQLQEGMFVLARVMTLEDEKQAAEDKSFLQNEDWKKSPR